LVNGRSLCITAGDFTRVGPHHRRSAPMPAASLSTPRAALDRADPRSGGERPLDEPLGQPGLGCGWFSCAIFWSSDIAATRA